MNDIVPATFLKFLLEKVLIEEEKLDRLSNEIINPNFRCYE